MSVYGAVAMAHSVDSDEYSSPTQFFFYLYDKRNVSKKRLELHIFTIQFKDQTECIWLNSVPTFLYYYKPYLFFFKHKTEYKYSDN